MWPNNAGGFIVSLFFYVAVLFFVEILRYRLHFSPLLARRLTILGITSGALFLPGLFADKYWFLLAPTIYALIYLFGSGLKGAQAPRKAGVLGAVYIFLAIIALFYLFWEDGRQPFAVAGLLVLGWGDTLAALVGTYLGRHKFYIYDEEKSWEGTLGMFAGSWGALAYVGSSRLALVDDQLFAYVTLTAALAALLEAVAVRRSDNLVVPVGAAFLFYYLVQTNIPSAQIALLLTGIVGSFIIALVAYGLKSLNEGGVSGAVLVGTFIYTFGGWNWVPPILVFFISASILTHWSRRSDREVLDKENEARGLSQVLANGGVGVALAVISFLNILEPHLVYIGFLASMAAVAADTWGTEIGLRLGDKPRLIFTRKQVLPGTSGGVTRAGLWGAFGGSLVITLTAVTIFWSGGLNLGVVITSSVAVLIAGFSGAIIDSILGATLQVQYYCEYCLKPTEKPIHTCGFQTKPVKGLSWLDNDWVNFITSLSSALLAMGILLLLS